MKEGYDYVIVGAGFTGATIANILSTRGKYCLVVDSRDYVGGTSADHVNVNGLLAPRFGPHAFHTNSVHVWNYLNKFADFNDYVQVSKTRHKGELYDIPLNANTIEKFFDTTFASEVEVRKFVEDKQSKFASVLNSEDLALSTMGRELYKAFYAGYTEKQWAESASSLNRAVLGRVPVRFNRDNRYFTDKFQGLPIGGYSQLIRRMLDGIDVQLLTTITIKEALDEGAHVVWTGPLDEAFAERHGALDWRSVYWEETHSDITLPAAVVHEADIEVPYTRTTDVGYFDALAGKGNLKRTTHLTEYSCQYTDPKCGGEKFYPVVRPHTDHLLNKYKLLAANLARVSFMGRMGSFNYLNMDQAVSMALAYCDGVK